MEQYGIVPKSLIKGISDALRGRGHVGGIAAKDFASKINQLPKITPYKGQSIPWVGSRANQAVAIARSYWEARLYGQRSFVYSGGSTFYNGTDVNDVNGNGVIDCSTYIRLVLSGVDYMHSPYVTGNSEDGRARKDLYFWADERLESNEVRFAADLAEYFYLTGRVLDGFDDLKPGDIIFHANGSIKNRFMGISHVSIVAEEGHDQLYYYNVTDIDGVVVRTRWSARNDYVFAARPNYEPFREYSKLDENINLLVPPWNEAPSTKYECTMSVSDDGKSLTAVGTPTSGATFNLINGSYPLYLLPGHYTLSGAPKRDDVNSGYTWGLVVKNVNTNVDCGWDLGNGAEFTLTEITPVRAYIYISSSKSPDGYVWTPRLVGRETGSSSITGLLLQDKTVVPSELVQVVTPDDGYYGLSSVTVEPAELLENAEGVKFG